MLLCIVDLGVRLTDKVVAEGVDTIGWVEEDQRPFSFPPTNELKHRLHIVLYCFTHLMVLDIDIILAEEAVILDIIGVITYVKMKPNKKIHLDAYLPTDFTSSISCSVL